jgi:hypothetical protein
MAAKQVYQVSGHSVRVGAAQDLLALNIDRASIMQAGRWRSSRMPMPYGEEILAARGGMARAAAEQGRVLNRTILKLRYEQYLGCARTLSAGTSGCNNSLP